jgi:proline dehydrogenase
MPGEEISDALETALKLQKERIPVVVTHLGENVGDEAETGKVRDHYLEVLDQIQARGLDTQISVKLTELGLDQNPDLCYRNLAALVQKARALGNFVWIDMEGSDYTSRTLDIFGRIRSGFPNTGLCLQAYLFRTDEDLEKLMPLSPAIRLVKGAYAEPSHIAFPSKRDTNKNFTMLAIKLLQQTKSNQVFPAFATHDLRLIRRIENEAGALDVPKRAFEVQMLYGIRTDLQKRLIEEGFRVRVLISYGAYWFPWYMRRLAERPANILFVLRNILR